MKRILALLMLLAAAPVAYADRVSAGGGSFGGGAFGSPLLAPDGVTCTQPAYSFNSDSDTGFNLLAAGNITVCLNSQRRYDFGVNGLFTTIDGFSTGATITAVDTYWRREAAGIWGASSVAVAAGTNSQGFRLYNFRDTGGSNYERVGMTWTTNQFNITSEALGTGTARLINIDSGSATQPTISVGGSQVAFFSLSGSSRVMRLCTANGFPCASGAQFETGSTGYTGIFSIQGLNLTASTMTAENTSKLLTSTHSYTWSNAQVVALGATTTGDINAVTLPAKTQLVDAMVVITGAGAGTTTLTVSCGDAIGGAPFTNLVLTANAQAAANTVYGDAVAERGTAIDTEFYYLPSYTATTLVTCRFISTGANLSAVTGSSGRFILTTRLLP